MDPSPGGVDIHEATGWTGRVIAGGGCGRAPKVGAVVDGVAASRGRAMEHPPMPAPAFPARLMDRYASSGDVLPSASAG